MTKHAALTNY